MSAVQALQRNLADFARACGGRLQGENRSYTGVSSDSRSLQRGELFVALRGPNFDGGAFVAAAQAAGAVGAVLDAQQAGAAPNISLPYIEVDDTLAALTRAAHAWRQQFTLPVIGIAGSNGKTTVKEMTAAILSQTGACMATRGNLNNHIGVPLTLLRLEPTQRYAVIEMGANRAGDVAQLVEIAAPTVGLITNAGAEHLEGFGSLEGVARAEGEMVAGLAPDATAVINADDAYVDLWRSLTAARVMTFGIERPADFRARELRTQIGKEGFNTEFTLVTPLGQTAITLKLAGRHNVLNALGAAAAAVAAGVSDLESIAAGLAGMRAVQGRLQFKLIPSGAWLVDDSYNANPSSVRAALDVMCELSGRKWLVLGDMAELGDFTSSSHADIGAYARERGIEKVFAIGQFTPLAVESFGAGGRWFEDVEALSRALQEELGADVRVLIKGSRVNRLERVADTLMGAAALAGTNAQRGVN